MQNIAQSSNQMQETYSIRLNKLPSSRPRASLESLHFMTLSSLSINVQIIRQDCKSFTVLINISVSFQSCLSLVLTLVLTAIIIKPLHRSHRCCSQIYYVSHSVQTGLRIWSWASAFFLLFLPLIRFHQFYVRVVWELCKHQIYMRAL